MGELLIRAGHDDHLVIGDLLAPGGAVAMRPPIDRLVSDAQTAALRPSLADSAHLAGVPYLIDPVTPLLQGPTTETDSWIKRVSFAETAEITPEQFDAARIEKLVEEVVQFELEHKATAILPPYLYASSPEDPAFTVSLQLLVATRRCMSRNGVNLPLIAVFCGGYQRFAREDAWISGVDRFVANAADVDPQALAVCLTPVGKADDSYAKVARVFLTARRFNRAGITTLAWRQGTFGPGLVAAGLGGYETGAGTREHADIRAQITRKKPKAQPNAKSKGGPPAMVYLEGLGRSVTLPIARALLGDLDTRARLICDDESCCPHGADSMLDNRVWHTVNARAQRMRDLNAMPEAWRLHQIGKDAEQAVKTTRRAALALRNAGITTSLETGAQDALARIAEHLRNQDAQRRSA